jgi:DNA-binding MarR family transcriptional regulator
MDLNSTVNEALALWHHVTLELVRGNKPDLSPRQMAVLLTTYMGPGPHTVRGMAQHLRISKPAVTRALDYLCEIDLVRRKTDADDRRSVLIHRTVKGSVFLSEFADDIQAAINTFLPLEAVEHEAA